MYSHAGYQLRVRSRQSPGTVYPRVEFGNLTYWVPSEQGSRQRLEASIFLERTTPDDLDLDLRTDEIRIYLNEDSSFNLKYNGKTFHFTKGGETHGFTARCVRDLLLTVLQSQQCRLAGYFGDELRESCTWTMDGIRTERENIMLAYSKEVEEIVSRCWSNLTRVLLTVHLPVASASTCYVGDGQWEEGIRRDEEQGEGEEMRGMGQD
jgi:hypothetical protein